MSAQKTWCKSIMVVLSLAVCLSLMGCTTKATLIAEVEKEFKTYQSLHEEAERLQERLDMRSDRLSSGEMSTLQRSKQAHDMRGHSISVMQNEDFSRLNRRELNVRIRLLKDSNEALTDSNRNLTRLLQML